MVIDGLMQRHFQQKNKAAIYIKDIMIRDVKSVIADDVLSKVKYLLDTYQSSGIPVTYRKQLVGILTRNDFKDNER